ncbi:MAG: aminodeoxychorismate synthase component I, partial [Phycisphaerae bacterium]|nr:aminodeoxychorismate synthase component I [Phycisphaerae bacterium]
IGPPPAPQMSRADYLARVDRIREYIAAGDVYQVNLTQRFSTRTAVRPIELFRRLCRVNPAPFAAFLAWDDKAVLSASPERFLDVRGRRVVTQPIKGTRPRVGDPVLDPVRRDELMQSEKDRAELNMIVDLLRNDLGRVCRFGSVRVLSAGAMEEHPTVFHRVATITGELADDCTWADLLRATFPGGSITGAPKIRAMQIIDELEPTPRDVYCGAVGCIGLDGSLSLNVAIRTMVMRGSVVHLYAGGGIVADSEPEAEYEETLAKAAGMIRAFGYDGATIRAL